jgi:ribosomal protein S18 acetylase RimI-like enzyme
MFRIDDFASDALSTAASENLAVHFTWVQQQTAGMCVIASDDLVLTDCGLPCDTFNAVCRARLTASSAPERIPSAIDYFAEAQRPFSWWVCPGDQPDELAATLQASGLEYAESELAMAADLDRLTQCDLSPDGLQIHRVQTTEELADFATIVAANWSPPDAEVLRFYELAAPVLLQPKSALWLYVGYLEGIPVASSELTVGGGVVGLYNICTLTDYRRRGFGAALSLQPLLDAREQGCHTAILQASDEGSRVYKRLGFEVFGQISEYKPRR